MSTTLKSYDFVNAVRSTGDFLCLRLEIAKFGKSVVSSALKESEKCSIGSYKNGQKKRFSPRLLVYQDKVKKVSMKAVVELVSGPEVVAEDKKKTGTKGEESLFKRDIKKEIGFDLCLTVGTFF